MNINTYNEHKTKIREFLIEWNQYKRLVVSLKLNIIMFPSGYTINMLNTSVKDTLVAHLGIEIIEIGIDFLLAKMPVDHRTKQPMGLLHGGASVALSETLGSLAASLLVDKSVEFPVGLEINANHIKSVKSGYVFGKVSPIHVGRRTHIWRTDIRNEAGKLVCTSKLTVAIIEKDNASANS